MNEKTSDLAAGFDAYHELLGIGPAEQPPHLYRLLGLTLFENSPNVIERAADRQMAHLRTFQTGPHVEVTQKLLNEVAKARRTLLSESGKAAYDASLARLATPLAAIQTVPAAEEPHSTAPAIMPGSHVLSRRHARGGAPVVLVGVAVAGLALCGIVWAFLQNSPQQTPVVVDGANHATVPAVAAPPAVAPPVQQSETPSRPDEHSPATPPPPGNEGTEPVTAPETPTAEVVESDTAPPSAANNAEKLRAEIAVARQALQDLPAFKKYYDYLQAHPESLPDTGSKLAEMIWEETQSDADLRDHLPSLLAALQEVERLSLAGKAYHRTLDAIDAQAKHPSLGPSGAKVVAAKAQVISLAAGAMPDARLKAQLRTWVAEVLPWAILEQDDQSLAQLLAADATCMRSSIDRMQAIAALLPAANDALEQNRLATAEVIVAHLDGLLKNTTAGTSRKQASDDVAALRLRLTLASAATAATDRLSTQPDDAAAHQAVGLHLLMNRGHWKESLTHLSQGADPQWRELAKTSLAEGRDGKSWAKLAARWADLTGEHQAAAQEMARRLYHQALADPQFVGFARVAAEKKANALGSSLVKVAAVVENKPAETPPTAPMEETEESLTARINANPKDAYAWKARGMLHHRWHRWEQAANDYAEAARLAPDDLWIRQDLAITSLAAGREKVYFEQCREIEARLQKLPKHDILHTRGARLLSLRPGGFQDGNPLLEMANKMAENSEFWALVHPLVSLHYRMGSYEDALREAKRVPLEKVSPDQRAPLHAWESMILWRLGRRDEAREALALAQKFRPAIHAIRGQKWGDTDVVTEALMAIPEAEALIGKD